MVAILTPDLLANSDAVILINCLAALICSQQASLPDLDTCDKLMRYQTSLNNQLSKQIGELVELEKTYAK